MQSLPRYRIGRLRKWQTFNAIGTPDDAIDNVIRQAPIEAVMAAAWLFTFESPLTHESAVLLPNNIKRSIAYRIVCNGRLYHEMPDADIQLLIKIGNDHDKIRIAAYCLRRSIESKNPPSWISDALTTLHQEVAWIRENCADALSACIERKNLQDYYP